MTTKAMQHCTTWGYPCLSSHGHAFLMIMYKHINFIRFSVFEKEFYIDRDFEKNPLRFKFTLVGLTYSLEFVVVDLRSLCNWMGVKIVCMISVTYSLYST